MSEPDNDTAAAPTRQAAIKPGSIAHRAISWMRAQGQGEEFLTSALAESLNVSPAGVIFALEQALAQGLVQRRQKQPGTRSPFWFTARRNPRPMVWRRSRSVCMSRSVQIWNTLGLSQPSLSAE